MVPPVPTDKSPRSTTPPHLRMKPTARRGILIVIVNVTILIGTTTRQTMECVVPAASAGQYPAGTLATLEDKPTPESLAIANSRSAAGAQATTTMLMTTVATQTQRTMMTKTMWTLLCMGLLNNGAPLHGA